MWFVIKIFARFLLTAAVLLALEKYLPDYFAISGSWLGLGTIAGVVTALNLLVRPILNLITLPIRLFATIIAIVLSNAAFLYITEKALLYFNPEVVRMDIRGGLLGWLIIALIFGAANWVMKIVSI